MKKLKYSMVPEHGLQVEETLAAGDREGAGALANYWWSWSVRKAMGYKQQVAVDLGCGCGYGTRILSEGFAAPCITYGIDLDKEGINLARKDYGNLPDLHFVGPANLDLAWVQGTVPHTIDLFTVFEVLEYIRRRDLFLDEIVSHLSPDGVALFSAGLYRLASDSQPKDAYFRYSGELLLRTLKRYFTVVRTLQGFGTAINDKSDPFAYVCALNASFAKSWQQMSSTAERPQSGEPFFVGRGLGVLRQTNQELTVPEQDPPPPFNSEQLIKAAFYFFNRCCREERIAPDDRPRLHPGYFIKWLRTADDPDGMPGMHPLSDNSAEIARELDVPEEAVEFVIRLGTSSTGAAHLNSFWPYLVLQNRQTSHPIRSVQLMLIIQWDDDTVCPLNRISHKDSNPVAIKDAEVVSMAVREGSQFAAHVMQLGCDSLHDSHQAFRGLASPDILAKIMLSCEDAAKAGKITAQDMTGIAQTVSYMATLFPRKIPEKVMQQFRQEKSNQGKPAEPKEAAGGWDAQGV